MLEASAVEVVPVATVSCCPPLATLESLALELDDVELLLLLVELLLLLLLDELLLLFVDFVFILTPSFSAQQMA